MRFSVHLQPLINRLFYGNVWIALMAAIQPHFSALLLNGQSLPSLDFFLFFATLAYYNLDRWVEVLWERPQNERLRWLKANQKEWGVFTLLPVFLGTYFFILLNQSTQIALFIAGLLALTYTLPVGFRLAPKRIGWLKPVLVAGIWTLLGPGLLVLESSSPTLTAGALTLVYFSWLLCLSLVFEWRDRLKDHVAHVANVWQKGSLKRMLNMLIALHAISLLLLLYFSYLNGIYIFISMLISTLICRWAVRKDQEMAYLFGVDGLLLLVPLFLWLGEAFP